MFFYGVSVIFIVIINSNVSCQHLDGPKLKNNGLCFSANGSNLEELKKLKDCVILVGNLIINLEATTSADFANISFPYLREVTGFVAVYRTPGLRSLGQLFGNLTLIRGQQLLRNYALGIHSMPNLVEIGLHSLITIERGGVLIWFCPLVCFVETVNWEAIAPRGARVISKSNAFCDGPKACRCMNFPDIDYCWNRKKCQRFLAGPVKEKCHEQCLGCKKTDNNKCSRCKNYTNDHTCVSKCPEDKFILPPTRHCLTKQECYELYEGKGWILNKTCVEHCPKGYMYVAKTDPLDISNGTCVKCEKCTGKRECNNDVTIYSLAEAERYSHCTYINGSLNINIQKIHESSMDELKMFLGQIERIRGFLAIYNSIGITSLEFLKNLKIIEGKILKEKSYVIFISGMKNLRKLFPKRQTKALKILNGTMRAFNNPQLCMFEIENFHKYLNWPMAHPLDIPWNLNGYLGECHNIPIPLDVTVVGERAVRATFNHIKPVRNPNITLNYFLRYVEVPPDVQTETLPLYCNEKPWKTIDVDSLSSNYSTINLTMLRPSTVYGIYVEAYPDTIGQVESSRNLSDYGRSLVKNFTTATGIPPPPFIVQIAALSAYSFALNWVINPDYAPHITRYLLDYSIINYNTTAIDAKDHCQQAYTLSERDIEDYVHVAVKVPPLNYGEFCICANAVNFRRDTTHEFIKWAPNNIFQKLSPIAKGKHFDVCDSPNINCTNWKDDLLDNITINGVIQSVGVELEPSRHYYVADDLLPYHDYKVRLRACTGSLETECGRSSLEIVRTQMISDNDLVNITSALLNDTRFNLTWNPPKTPNGFVLAYIVQLKVDEENSESVIEENCITRVRHEANRRAFIMDMTKRTSEYRVRVCTSSIAISRKCSVWLMYSAKSVESQEKQGLYSWLVVVIVTVIIGAVSVTLGIKWWRKRIMNVDRAHLLENIELHPIERYSFGD